MNRSRDSRHSDTKLPAQPSRYRPVTTDPPAAPQRPPTGIVTGVPPTLDSTSTTTTNPVAVTLTASGDGNIVFMATPNDLPSWLTLNPATGLLSGTAPFTGLYSFDVIVLSPYGVEANKYNLTIVT